MKNRSQYSLTEYTVCTELPISLTVGLVSDLHESDPKEVLSLLRQGKPDMIMNLPPQDDRHFGRRQYSIGSQMGESL